jgi:hypothetical protein
VPSPTSLSVINMGFRMITISIGETHWVVTHNKRVVTIYTLRQITPSSGVTLDSNKKKSLILRPTCEINNLTETTTPYQFKI